ncbi:MAG: zinc ribbon domain-containing protein [Methylomagnum sp.]
MNYTTCPKCHHIRQPTDPAPPDVCPACGLVFRKWEKYHGSPRPDDASEPAPKRVIYSDTDPPPPPDGWPELLLACPDTGPPSWAGRCLVLALLLVWGGWFGAHGPDDYIDVGESFLHRVDLIFHEAGHTIFRPFGDFLHVLGGSLGQVLMPLIVMIVFLRQGNAFGAAVGLWWVGQSAMDVAIYINDARALELPLLGGGTGYDDPDRHDWNNLLGRLGLLQRDHAIAGFTYMLGRVAMLLAGVWGGAVLWRQFRQLRRDEF